MFSVLSGRKHLASSPVLKTAQLLLNLIYSESVFLLSDLSLSYRSLSPILLVLFTVITITRLIPFSLQQSFHKADFKIFNFFHADPHSTKEITERVNAD